MKPKKYYISCRLETKRRVLSPVEGVEGWEVAFDWADGQVGVCAVFTSKRKAEKYAGKGNVISGYGDAVKKETKAND